MTALPPQSESLAPRLARVQVGIRPELEVSRHIFRGQPSYVIQDPVTFASHQFSQRDYQVFGALDGRRTLEEVFRGLVERGVLSDPQQEQFYQYIVQLHQLGLLSLPVSDVKSLYGRFEKKQAARRRGVITGILFLRVPLWHPDAFLNRTVKLFAPLFTRAAFTLWLIAAVLSISIIGLRIEEFRNPLGTMLALQNLPVLWVLLVGLKLIHEFGHAYACKQLGGHVPEMGAYFILFTPCAYMDASASWGFTERWHRIIVALAGIYFESMAAIVALLVWCLTEPSTVHSIAQYTIILSTAVTIGFNINPLMKFDGYYVLSDLVNLPNLRQHAASELQNLLKYLMFGIRSHSVLSTTSGRVWLSLFGLAAAVYKVLLVLSISGLIAMKFPVAGIALAAGHLGSTIWRLGASLVSYVACSEEVAPVRRRAVVATGIAVAMVTAAVMMVPAPYSIEAVGVVARSDDTLIRSPATGFLREAFVEAGDAVQGENVLCVLENAEIEAELRKAAAQVQMLRIDLYDQTNHNLEAAAIERKLRQAEIDLEKLDARFSDLTVRAPDPGQITDAVGIEAKGRFVKKGEPLAVLSHGGWIVNVLADEQAITAHLPAAGEAVEVRVDGQWGQVLEGEVVGVQLSGSSEIPYPALTHINGGKIPVSAGTQEADQPYFPVRIAVSGAGTTLRHGMTTRVTLARQAMPLGAQLYRRLLQFMNRLQSAPSAA